jgi:NAD(P) transhydrogenase subunit beta
VILASVTTATVSPLATTVFQDSDFIRSCYIVAFVCFIQGLRMLRTPVSARKGNVVAAVGMAIAVGATLLWPQVGNWGLIIVGIAVGTAIGVPAARSVRMTAMPQMVALFNGVGGGAVALIAWAEFRRYGGDYPLDVAIPSLLSAIIGSVSFWGSNIAFGKLQEILPGRPIMLPGRLQLVLNFALLAIAIACAVVITASSGHPAQGIFIALLVSAAILGNTFVLPIGGADMPVVISLLNAFTGLSAAAAGISLDNSALIVGGILVGASGTILTRLMAEAMNRSIANIFKGGFGGVSAAPTGDGEAKPVRSTSADDVAIQLAYASKVVIIPGYGMAVAQAQHAVRELTKQLEKRGVDVSFAIHPVAGRMPGHMNVLLAEADVPYDQLKEMDDINGEFSRTDVSLVIGANDVVNPAARDVPDSPIYGMPVLNADESHSIIVLKRSMNTGFAGIDNPLFYDDKTSMLFGDAKDSITKVTKELEAL